MISVSPELSRLMGETRPFVYSAEIEFLDGRTVSLSEDDICGAGNRILTSAGSSSLPIGNALSRSLSLNFFNTDDRYSDYDFFGAIITVSAQVELSQTTELIDLGTYTVTEPETYGTTISLTAYDNMYKADKVYEPRNVVFPSTARNVYMDACQQCVLNPTDTDFTNNDFVIQKVPDGMTCRQVLGLIAMLAGGNAVVSGNNVRIVSYGGMMSAEEVIDGGIFDSGMPYRTGAAIQGGNFNPWDGDSVDGGTLRDAAQRQLLYPIMRQTVSTDDVLITGVCVRNGENEATSGTSGYILVLSNELVQGSETQAANAIGTILIGLKFRPFEIATLAYPLAEFGDVCYLANGASVYGSFVTDIDFTFAGQTTIKCSADSPIRNNSKSYTQAATVRQMRALVQREATLRELAYNDLAQRLDDVGGLYYTAERQQDGSYIYYLHNEPTIAASTIVWKMTKDALGVSTDGGNTWNAGLTVDGNLIANILNANGVNADWIRSGSIEVRDGSSTLLFSVDKDTGNVYISGDRVFIGDQTATQALGNLSGALAITLSNEMQGIPVDDQGHYDTFPNVETDIRFIYGGQDVTDAVNVSYSEFNVSGNLTYDSTNHVYTYTPTALTDDTGYVTFSGTYSAQTGSVSVTRRFNLYKAYAGPEGTARIYYLESDCDIVKLGQDNAYYPQTVTFSAFYRDGKEATRYPYSGLFEIQVTTDGTNWETVVAPEENKTAQTYTITGDDIQDIRCKFYSQATFNDIYFLFGDDTGVLEDTSGSLLETAHVIDVIDGGALLDIKTVPIVEDVSHLTQEAVFNILTGGGSRQGIYLATDPSDGKVKVYINAEYLATGILRSHDGSTTWNLDTGAFKITPNTIVGNGSSLGDLQLNVSATAEGLQTEVTARQNGDNSLSSRITQNANSIQTEVTAREGLASRVTQTENTISTQVLGSGSTSLKSQIQQNASDISTKVSAGDVESAIEQNAQSIRLRATKIAWSASKSSMTENGVLSAQDGNFSGTITSSTITGGTVKNSNKNSYMVIKDGVLDVYRNVFDDLVRDYRVLRMTVDDYYDRYDLNVTPVKVATEGAYPRDFSSATHGLTSTYNNQAAIYGAGGIHFFKANNTSAMFLTATDAYFYQYATFAKNVWCKNKLYVQEVETIGKKSRSVDTEDYGRRRLYCYETPSPMFGDVGEGTINEDGLCYVPLDPTFSETISTSQYQVFLQSYGDGACYVQKRKSSYFVVAGTPGLTFGWEIKGKQIDYDQVRLERSSGDAETDQTDYGEEALGHINEINEGRVA